MCLNLYRRPSGFWYVQGWLRWLHAPTASHADNGSPNWMVWLQRLGVWEAYTTHQLLVTSPTTFRSPRTRGMKGPTNLKFKGTFYEFTWQSQPTPTLTNQTSDTHTHKYNKFKVFFLLRNWPMMWRFLGRFFFCFPSPPPKKIGFHHFFWGQHFLQALQISLGPVSLTVGNEQMVDARLKSETSAFSEMGISKSEARPIQVVEGFWWPKWMKILKLPI